MPSRIVPYRLQATGNTTVYSSGAARGKVRSVMVNYNSSAAGTDVTISDTDIALNQTLYADTDSNTDIWVYPKLLATTNAGASLTVTGNIYTEYIVYSRLKLVTTGNDSDDVVDVTVYVEEF